MKKLTALLMALVLLFSLTAPALAASVQATSFLLEKTEGTVSVTSGSGKTMPKKSGMHLYSGYSVATEKKSYAYISLDHTKVIKLDASSQTQVEASGKKLELNVTEGSMFFDVSEPLTSKESLTIRTSTMVTGIRGTCGWVSVIDRYTTRISLLEGQLAITSIDPLTGLTRTTVIVGGQTATIVFRGMGSDVTIGGETGGSTAGGNIGGIGGGTAGSGAVGGSTTGGIPENQIIQDLIEVGTIRDEHIILTGTGLTVESLQEEDVPGFVAVEVKKDPALQERIEKNSPLSVPAIIGNAENRLAQDEAAAEKADQAIQDAVDHLQVEEVDPVFGQSASGEAAGGASGGGGTNDPSGGGTTTYYALTVKHQTADGAPIPNIMDEVTQFAANTSYNAVPQVIAGYTYTGFSGDAMSGTMNSDKTVIFIYELTNNTPALEYSLTIICEDESGDLVGDTDVQILAEGTAYDVSNPPPISGYQYVGVKNGSDPLTGTMNSNKTITFVYTPTGTGDDTTSTPTNYTLTVNSKTISYNVTAGAMGEATNPATTIQNANNPQTITAPAGHIIASIEGDGIVFSLSNDRTTASITMDSDKEITATYLSTTVNMTSPSTAQLRNVTAYYTEYSALYSIPSDVKITLNITGDISLNTPSSVTIPANFIVNLSGATSLASNATLDTAEGTQLNVTSGTFTNNGTISGQGTMNVAAGATVNNNGDILVEHNESMHVSGTVNNYGTVKVGTADSVGALVVEISGQLNNLEDDAGTIRGTLTVASGSTLTVNGTITTESRIENAGTMTVTGTVTGQNLYELYGANDPHTIYNTGTLTVNGGSVTHLTNDANDTASAAIYAAAGGTVTVKDSSTVEGYMYAIRSASSSTINITGGTVSGDIAVSVSGSLNMTDGNLNGKACGIQNTSNSMPDNVIVDGGTIYVSGTDEETTRIIEGNITFNGGILQSDINVFSGKQVSTDLGLDPPTESDGKFTVVRNNASTYTFPAFAPSADLTQVMSLNYSTINLMEGGELTNTTAATALASGKTLNVKGGALTVAEDAELAVSGKLTVADGARIICEGVLSSTEDSTINNDGAIMFTNSCSDLSQLGEEERAKAEARMENTKLLGTFTNGTTGLLSVGAVDKTGVVSDYGVLKLGIAGGTVVNEGEIHVYSASSVELSGDLTNNNILQNAGEIESTTGDLINNGSVSNTGELRFYGDVTNNGSVSSTNELYIAGSAQLTNAANGTIYIMEQNSRLQLGSSGSKVQNNGTIYVDEQSQMSNSGTFTNSGTFYAAGSIYTSNVFTNSASGKLWVGYAATVEGETDLLFCMFTNTRTLENLGEIYIAPDSMLKNHLLMYNAGTIDLGNTGRYPSEVLTENLDDARLLNGEGNTSGIFYNGRTADGTTASGTLNLYSGQLYNDHSSNSFVNKAAEGNNEGGIIHLKSDARFTNSTQFSPAEGGKFYLNGTFEDRYNRVGLYVMVMDSNNDNLVMAYENADTVFPDADNENAAPFTWTEGYTYRLVDCSNGSIAAQKPRYLPAVNTDKVTLDLGGYPLVLASPLQVGEAVDTVDPDDPEISYTSGVKPGSLTIVNNPNMAGAGGGSLTVDHNAADSSLRVVYVTAGTFNMTGGTLKLESVDNGYAWPITPLYVNPCGIWGSYDAEEPSSFAGVSVVLDGCTVVTDDTATSAIYVTNGGNGIEGGEENCQITVKGGTTINSSDASSDVGIDLYGSDINVTIDDGSKITSSGNGISISASDTSVVLDGDAEICVGDANSTDCAGIINNTEGDSSGVKISVINGGKISTAEDVPDTATCYGILGRNAFVFIGDGIVSVNETSDYSYGISVDGNGSVYVNGDSTLSGYYGISAEGGDSGNPTITINGGTVTGSGGDGLSVSNGTVTMNAGTVSGGSNGIQIQDSSNSDNPNLVTLNITGGTISTAATGDFSTLTGYGILYTYESVKPKFTVGNTPFSPSGNDTWYTYPSTTFTDGATITGGTAAIGICPLGG